MAAAVLTPEDRAILALESDAGAGHTEVVVRRGRPLWRIEAIPFADGGGALVWRMHHALADGTAAMRAAGSSTRTAGSGAFA